MEHKSCSPIQFEKCQHKLSSWTMGCIREDGMDWIQVAEILESSDDHLLMLKRLNPPKLPPSMVVLSSREERKVDTNVTSLDGGV